MAVAHGEALLGPLDLIEELEYEISALEELVEESFGEDDDVDRELVLAAQEINNLHPALDAPVIVYGSLLTPSMGEDLGMQPLTFRNDDPMQKRGYEVDAVSGIYKGVVIRSVWDAERSEEGYTTAHVLETGEEHYIDDFYNKITKEYLYHVSTYGSTIVPVLPQNSHSFRDLANDRVSTNLIVPPMESTNPLIE